MYRLDVRADNIPEQGAVIIIEATPLAHKLVATATCEKAETLLQMLSLSKAEILHIMNTFADGEERMLNVEADSSSLKKAGFA